MASAQGLWVAVLLLGAVVGCGRTGGSVTLMRLSDDQRFGQAFREAYAARGEQGDWDIILVQDGLQTQPRRASGEAIEVSDHVPVRHVVRLHVFWRPNHSGGDEPAQSNASIDWYVITPGAREGEDLLKYQGAGFVGVYPGDTHATVVMRKMRLQRQVLRGAMHDPLEQASLSGDVRAVLDARYVRNALRELGCLESGRSFEQEANP